MHETLDRLRSGGLEMVVTEVRQRSLWAPGEDTQEPEIAVAPAVLERPVPDVQG
jgi:hypothetical protein